MSTDQFWAGEGLNHIMPQGFGEFPEGFDVRNEVKKITEDLSFDHVIDFGCGYGRLCESFKPESYLGIDINPSAIDEAKKQFAQYKFEILPNGPKGADLYFAYTVFLHMTDTQLHEALKNIRCKWLVVGEVLGREWRREGLPPVYNRDLEDYVTLMRSHDLVLHRHVRKPYKRYSESPWYQGKNTDVSFLVFKKCLRNPLA